MPYNIGETLKKYRNEAKMSVKQISELLTQKGFKASESTIYSWENENSQPTPGALLVMCKTYGIEDVLSAFGYNGYKEDSSLRLTINETDLIEKYRYIDDLGRDSVDHILRNEYNRKKQAEQERQQVDQQHEADRDQINEPSQYYGDNVIPLYDEKQNQEDQVELNYRTGEAGAGSGVDADNVEIIQVSYPANRVPRGADYIIPVTGDSMEPTFYDGDMLFFELGSANLYTGDIGIFVINGETLVKELGDNELISHNKKYAPIKIHEWDSVRVEGKVLGKM